MNKRKIGVVYMSQELYQSIPLLFKLVKKQTELKNAAFAFQNKRGAVKFFFLIERDEQQDLRLLFFKNEEELEKQQLYTDIEQTLLSLHTGYSEHQQALSQLDAETLVLKESERKWEEGLISVFQLMEARNRFIAAKAELVRVRLQIEMMMKLEKYYRQGTFL